jgi:hypothetical protein
MLRIDKVDTSNGLTVYGDSDSEAVFYVLPDQPRLRLDQNGLPVFKFVKYRDPIDRGGGRKGGGFIIFDAEFAVPDTTMNAVRTDLSAKVAAKWAANNWGAPPPVTIGQIVWASGTVKVQCLDNGGVLVDHVDAPVSPSLYGNNVTAVTVELSDLGAPLAEAALQGAGAGIVQVIYDLKFWTALPKIEAHAWFHASEFYHFSQTITVDYDVWGEDSYQQTLREQFASSQAEGVEITTGIGVDDNLREQIRTQLQKNLEDIIKTKMLEQIKPVDPSDRGDRGDDSVKRDFLTTKVEDFDESYNENMTVEWEIFPNGTLPTITSMKDKNGQPLKWSNYAVDVDLNDPFFQTLRIDISSPIAWDQVPIDSVDVTIIYGAGGSKNQTFHLDHNQQSAVYERFMDKDGSAWQWTCTVNYTNRADSYTSPAAPGTGTELTLDAALTGLLSVHVEPGNLDFAKVSSAQVTFNYTPKNHPPIESLVTLTKDARTGDWHAFLLEPQTTSYSYQVEYTLNDGTTYVRSPISTLLPVLPVNSPFNANRTVTVRAAGNLDAGASDAPPDAIADISVDLTYTDPANNYTVNNSVTLSKNQAFVQWMIPVVNLTGGTITYSGSIRRKSGAIDPIPLTTATSNTIELGDIFAAVLNIHVATDLIDWSKIQVIELQLHYTDPAHGIDVSDDLLLNQASAPQSWTVDLIDQTRRSYTWTATYYVKGGPTSVNGPNITDHTILLLPAV